jgi:hypothetical protein
LKKTRSGVSVLTLLSIDAAIEGATGVALILFPASVVSLLFATDLPLIGIVLSRFAGIALFGLSLGCWLARRDEKSSGVLVAMLVYNICTTAYFAWLGIRSDFVGPLLWPALVVHAAASLLLGATWRSTARTKGPG